MSAASEISVANQALDMISRSSIQSFEESSPEARKSKEHFDAAKRSVFEQYDWPTARVVTPLVLAESLAVRGWAYVYHMPTEVAKVWFVGNARLKSEPGTQRHPYEFGEDTLGTFIYTDIKDAYLRYTSLGVPIGRLPQYLQDLIAHNLAQRLVMPLRRDAKLKQFLDQSYFTTLSAARTLAANDEPEMISHDYVPETIRDRRI